MRKLLMSLVMVVAVSFATASPLRASDGDEDGHDFHLQADLQPCCGAGKPKAKGEIHRQIETAKGVISKEKFTVKVALAVDWADYYAFVENAKTAEVLLTLSDSDGPYAECRLPFWKIKHELDDWELKSKAIFQIALEGRVKKGQWIQKKNKYGGSCDVNLTEAGVQPGIPEILDGDVANVFMDGAWILEGTVELDE